MSRQMMSSECVPAVARLNATFRIPRLFHGDVTGAGQGAQSGPKSALNDLGVTDFPLITHGCCGKEPDEALLKVQHCNFDSLPLLSKEKQDLLPLLSKSKKEEAEEEKKLVQAPELLPSLLPRHSTCRPSA